MSDNMASVNLILITVGRLQRPANSIRERAAYKGSNYLLVARLWKLLLDEMCIGELYRQDHEYNRTLSSQSRGGILNTATQRRQSS